MKNSWIFEDIRVKKYFTCSGWMDNLFDGKKQSKLLKYG